MCHLDQPVEDAEDISLVPHDTLMYKCSDHT